MEVLPARPPVRGGLVPVRMVTCLVPVRDGLVPVRMVTCLAPVRDWLVPVRMVTCLQQGDVLADDINLSSH
jgi:hypothetical protein